MKIKPHTIGLVCKNLAASVAFYRLLGFNIPEPEPNEPHVEYEAENGWVFGFDAENNVKALDPNWHETKGGRLSLQFECENTQTLDEIYITLIKAGYEGYKEPWDAFWGQRFGRVLDPDGNIISFFCNL